MNKKLLTIIVIAIVSVQLGFMALFVKSCVCFTKDDYRETAWYGFNGVQDALLDAWHMQQKDIDNFKLYSEKEDSLNYIFEWYQLSDTNDSIFVSGRIEKRFPYSTRVTSSISTSFLEMYKQGNSIDGQERYSDDGSYVKWRRTLNNLFDTTVVNSANVIDYICLLPSDTFAWTVKKEKIAEYIGKGYYTIESNKTDTLIIGFYNYVGIGITENIKYKISDVAIIPMENNVIGLSLDTPYYTPNSYNHNRIAEEKAEEY